MFYDTKSIDSMLNCQNCARRFDIPRVLPCGNIICNRCLEKIILMNSKATESDDVNRFKCELCEDEHRNIKRLDDYPIQKQIQKLLDVKPTHVSRGSLYENTYNLVNKLEIKLNELKDNNFNKIHKLNDYCEYLKFEIDISCESAIEEIRKSRDVMFTKIDTYEKECLEQLNINLNQNERENEQEASELVEFLNENMVYIQDCKQQLDTYTNLDDKLLENFYKKSKQILKNLNLYENKLNYSIFNGKYYYINETQSCALLNNNNLIESILDERNLSILLDLNRLESLNSFNFKFNFKDNLNKDSTYLIHHIDIAPLKQSSFILIVQYYNSKTNLFSTHFLIYDLILNSNTETVDSQVQQQSDEPVFSLELKEILHNDNLKFELLTTYENLIICIFSNLNSTYRLSVFNCSLEIVKEINILDYVPKSICTSYKSIYILSNTEPFIHAYDLNLNEIKKYGQCTNPTDAYYITNAWYLYVNQTKLFYTNHYNTTINVLCEANGKCLKRIDINFDNSKILVDQLSRFLIFNRLKKKLVVYTIDFDLDLTNNDFLLYEKDFNSHFNYESMHNFYTFCVTNDGHLVICDLDNSCLYVY